MKLHKFYLKRLGGLTALIDMTEAKERGIFEQMSRIEGIRDFFNLQIQAGYQLYARTHDKEYLGCSTLAKSLLKRIEDLDIKSDEPEQESGGYEATA